MKNGGTLWGGVYGKKEYLYRRKPKTLRNGKVSDMASLL